MQVPARLLELQEADSAIDRLSSRRTALESGLVVAEPRRLADEAEQRYGELRLQMDELNRDQGKFEHEIDSINQKMAAEEKRMYEGNIVNTRELEALQHEIESLKKRRTEREDELLVLLERKEELETASKEAEEVALRQRDDLSKLETDADLELVQVLADLEHRTAERHRVAETIDAELLDMYEELRKSKKGVGAAALTDGVCGGCHEQLSPVELDRIKKAEGIRRCEHCRRILVF